VRAIPEQDNRKRDDHEPDYETSGLALRFHMV
jgi:hypothetical protein